MKGIHQAECQDLETTHNLKEWWRKKGYSYADKHEENMKEETSFCQTKNFNIWSLPSHSSGTPAVPTSDPDRLVSIAQCKKCTEGKKKKKERNINFHFFFSFPLNSI